MRLLLIFAAVLPLAGCATSDATAILDTLAKNYAHCERDFTYSAGVGVLGGGATIAGRVKCEPTTGLKVGDTITIPIGTMTALPPS